MFLILLFPFDPVSKRQTEATEFETAAEFTEEKFKKQTFI